VSGEARSLRPAEQAAGRLGRDSCRPHGVREPISFSTSFLRQLAGIDPELLLEHLCACSWSILSGSSWRAFWDVLILALPAQQVDDLLLVELHG
jgi:hypothetical protein